VGYRTIQLGYAEVSTSPSNSPQCLNNLSSDLDIHVRLPLDRFNTTAGPFVAIILYYGLPACIADALVQCLLELLQGLLREDTVEFLTNTYIPRFQQALQDNDIDRPSLGTRLSLFSQFIGVVMKLVSDDTLMRNAHLFSANLMRHFYNV